MLIGDKMIIAKSKYRKFPMTSSVSQGLRPHAWPFFIFKTMAPRTPFAPKKRHAWLEKKGMMLAQSGALYWNKEVTTW